MIENNFLVLLLLVDKQDLTLYSYKDKTGELV